MRQKATMCGREEAVVVVVLIAAEAIAVTELEGKYHIIYRQHPETTKRKGSS